MSRLHFLKSFVLWFDTHATDGNTMTNMTVPGDVHLLFAKPRAPQWLNTTPESMLEVVAA